METFTRPSLEEITYRKHGSSGLGYRTRALFWEKRGIREQIKPIFTLSEHDHDGCWSFRKLYLSYADEYNAAIEILGSWQHWVELKKCKWFAVHLEKWNEEIKVRDQAVAKKALIDKAKSGDVTAAKAINEMYKESKRGRPSKEELEAGRQAAEQARKKISYLSDRMKGK